MSDRTAQPKWLISRIFIACILLIAMVWITMFCGAIAVDFGTTVANHIIAYMR